jgi:hypothetical protein
MCLFGLKQNIVIKILTIFFLLISFVIKSQDEIITKEYQYDPDPNLTISRVMEDTIYYWANNQTLKIPSEKVIAIRKNYKDSDSKYIYIKPSDERIYGIKLGNAFFKADYKFNASNLALAKECFLERYRVYDTVFSENKEGDLSIRNNVTGKRRRVHKNIRICIYLRDDMLNRSIKGVVYHVSSDSSQLILKIPTGGERRIYSFRNEDIKAIEMESASVFLGRNALGLVMISTVFLAPTSSIFFKKKWYKKFDFDLWHLSK